MATIPVDQYLDRAQRKVSTANLANFAGVDCQLVVEKETHRPVIMDGTTLGGAFKAASLDDLDNHKSATSGKADTATKLATARTISLTGDATGSTTFDGSANKSIAVTLANSGVTAGTYGPTAAATLAFGGSVNIPKITVDAKGRVTASGHYAIKLPAAPTSVSGNAGTATKLATARTISLTGAVTGSTTFDGSANRSIATTYTAMRGATSSAAGTIGAVPAPAAGAQGKYLRGDGTWQTPTNTTYKNFTGATSDAAGAAGLVPAPAAGQNGRYLRGDGTWQTPPNTTYSNMTAATASAAGKSGLVPAPAAGNDDDYLMGNGKWGKPTSVSGNAGTATKLATARTIRTNLASTSSASFDGSANISPGVSGILPVANGGTGNDDGTVAKLTKARTFICNLESTTAGSFNGSANVTLGVSGELPIARGGTGRTDGHAPKDVLMAGARGNLAGYETPVVQSTALTISNTSRDTNLVTGAVKITVNNGSANQAWTKVVCLTNASATVSIGSSWKWVGGSAPDITANCALVLHWCSTFGIASLVTTS